MQLDTTHRGFHPDDIERLCEESSMETPCSRESAEKGTGISTHDSGVSHDFSNM
jgi:hypothetical protein